MTEVRITGVEDFAELEIRWRDLEARASGSIFQGWTWTGCLAAERFPDPVLVEATDDGRTVALALFNRKRRRFGASVLSLGESGTPELDCPYIEQNGVLAETARSGTLIQMCLAAVASQYDLVLSGIDDPVLAALKRSASLVYSRRSQSTPFIDLPTLPNGNYLDSLSANTRQQIRRSDRFFGRDNPIQIERAGSVAAALAMLDEMAALHQATWIARGKPGSFARPFFGRFHRALIATAIPRGEVALLRIFSGKTVIGILYNFVHRGRMVAYQSGFAYQAGQAHAKPGLTCHARAIQFALDHGLSVYDFLAGEDRYKGSLAGSSYQQHWAEGGSFRSPHLLLRAARRMFR